MADTKTEVRVRGEHFEQLVSGTGVSSADLRVEWENTLITEAENRGLQVEINYHHPRATNTPIAYPTSPATDEAIQVAESAALALAEKRADLVKADRDLEKHSDITIKIRRATHASIEAGLLAEQQRTKNPKLSQAAYIDAVVVAGIKVMVLRARFPGWSEDSDGLGLVCRDHKGRHCGDIAATGPDHEVATQLLRSLLEILTS